MGDMVCEGDIYFWRQFIVLTSDCLHSVGVGFILSFPSVLNPAILSPNSTDIQVTQGQASWISSIYGFVGAIGFCFIPGIMQQYGRKFTHIGMNVLQMIGFIMLAVADNVTTLYTARSIQGFCSCGVYLTSIILSEYVHPNRRGYFITLKKGAVAFGSLLCHSLVLICTWRQIAAIAIIPYVLSIILTFPWPESPAFYAMKGKYEDCNKSYIYLNGDTLQSRKELEKLISAQVERRQKEKREKQYNKLIMMCKIVAKKDFLKPFFIVTLLTVIIDSTGRYYNLVYIVQIMKVITGNHSVAIHCSIGLDFLAMIACWTSTYVITKFARRVMLFTFSYFSVALMFLISITVYLNSIKIVTNIEWILPCIILFNSFIVNLGVICVCFTISGEVFPLEYRGSGTTATGIVFTLLYAITIKCTPIMMLHTGIEGTYGIYGLCFVICLLILHFILPETKDKTLQEIEDEIKGNKQIQTVSQQQSQKLNEA